MRDGSITLTKEDLGRLRVLEAVAEKRLGLTEPQRCVDC